MFIIIWLTSGLGLEMYLLIYELFKMDYFEDDFWAIMKLETNELLVVRRIAMLLSQSVVYVLFCRNASKLHNKEW